MGTTTRLAGRITDWNDEKGFGFVVPNGGGDRAFVHVKAFERGSRRPVAGDLISYQPCRDRRGRINAGQIRHAGHRMEAPRTPRRLPRAAVGAGALAAAVGLAAAAIVPAALAAAVLGLSALAYGMYWLDKSAAQRGGPRTPENSFHLVSLAGGWPGALIAQQQFRHKTIKQPFQTVFWITVVANLFALVWLVSSGIATEVARSLAG